MVRLNQVGVENKLKGKTLIRESFGDN